MSKKNSDPTKLQDYLSSKDVSEEYIEKSENLSVFAQLEAIALKYLEAEGLYDPVTGIYRGSKEEIAQIVGEVFAGGAIKTIERMDIISSPDEDSFFTAQVSMGGILKTYATHDTKVDDQVRDRYGKHVNPATIRQRDEFKRMAHLDKKTGLPNENTFQDATILIEKDEDGFENRKPKDGRVIIMIDINQFKAFNDRYTKAAGNDVLRYTANELKRIVKDTLAPDDDEFEASNVFRLHGDEFIVLCHHSEAELLKDRIIAQFGQGDRIDDMSLESKPNQTTLPSGQKLGVLEWGGVPVSVSAGVGENTLEADKDMYKMKPEVHAQFPDFVRK